VQPAIIVQSPLRVRQLRPGLFAVKAQGRCTPAVATKLALPGCNRLNLPVRLDERWWIMGAFRPLGKNAALRIVEGLAA
jgi:hypothetical protein